MEVEKVQEEVTGVYKGIAKNSVRVSIIVAGSRVEWV